MSLKEALTDMFLVFGAAPPDRVDAFTRTVASDASCPACFERTARLAAKGPKAPTPASFLVLYRDAFEDGHRDHIGQDVLQVSAGAQEGFWRSKAAAIIKPRVGGDVALASFITAHMWWLEFPPDLDLISAEFASSAGQLWIDAARSFLAGKDVPAEVERMYAMARRAAITPPGRWPEAEWARMSGIGALDAAVAGGGRS